MAAPDGLQGSGLEGSRTAVILAAAADQPFVDRSPSYFPDTRRKDCHLGSSGSNPAQFSGKPAENAPMDDSACNGSCYDYSYSTAEFSNCQFSPFRPAMPTNPPNHTLPTHQQAFAQVHQASWMNSGSDFRCPRSYPDFDFTQPVQSSESHPPSAYVLVSDKQPYNDPLLMQAGNSARALDDYRKLDIKLSVEQNGSFGSPTLNDGPEAAGETNANQDITSLPSISAHPDNLNSSHSLNGRQSEEPAADREEPYAKLIYRCLLEAPGNTMVLRDIYQWFRANTEKGRDPDVKGWQNSIRHNLSMNAAFQKVDPPPNDLNNPSDGIKRGNLWRLTESAILDGVKSTTRYRSKLPKKRGRRSLHPAPQRQASGAKGGQAARKAARLRRSDRLKGSEHTTGMQSYLPNSPMGDRPSSPPAISTFGEETPYFLNLGQPGAPGSTPLVYHSQSPLPPHQRLALVPPYSHGMSIVHTHPQQQLPHLCVPQTPSQDGLPASPAFSLRTEHDVSTPLSASTVPSTPLQHDRDYFHIVPLSSQRSLFYSASESGSEEPVTPSSFSEIEGLESGGFWDGDMIL